MKSIKCLIVEDEELARDLLEKFIEKIPHLEVVGKCENPLLAMEVLQKEKVDLMFLDIQMPELTGVEFLKMLPNKPVVIFTTAYPSYALEGYQLDVTDYLLKPFSFERFVQAVNKASEMIRLKAGNNLPTEQANNTSTSSKTAPSKEYLLVNSEHKIIKIKYSDIRYIEAMREYVAYHTHSQGRVLSLMSLKKLEVDLPDAQFIRIHKSYIINVNEVGALEGNMVHIGKDKIPIGASYKEGVVGKIF